VTLDPRFATDAVSVRVGRLLYRSLVDLGDRSRPAPSLASRWVAVSPERFQLYSLAWVAVRTPDIFRYAFHSASLPPSGANRGRYRDADADRLIDAAEEAASPEEQAALYRALQAHLLDSLHAVPLWYEDPVAVLRAGLTGFGVTPDGSYDGLVSVTRGRGAAL
jgi:peptide/nickel transport system substrate-binding protein